MPTKQNAVLFVGKGGIAPPYSVLSPDRMDYYSRLPYATIHARTIAPNAYSSIRCESIKYFGTMPTTRRGAVTRSNSLFLITRINFSCFLCFYDSLLHVALNHYSSSSLLSYEFLKLWTSAQFMYLHSTVRSRSALLLLRLFYPPVALAIHAVIGKYLLRYFYSHGALVCLCVLSPAELCLAVYINPIHSLLPVLYLVTHTVCANNAQAKFSSWQLSPAGQHHPQDGAPFADSFGVSARLSFHNVKVCRCPQHSRGHGFRPWWPCARWPTAVKVLYYSRGGLRGGARYFGPDVWRNWLTIRHRQRGGLRVVSYCPRLRPWAGCGLMQQTSRRPHARRPRLLCQWPCSRPWLPWRSLSRPLLAPCVRPYVWQRWHVPRPWQRVYGPTRRPSRPLQPQCR